MLNSVFKNLLLVSLLLVIGVTTYWCLFSLVGSQSLVHDEAVYLAKGRSWLEGTPADEFRPYRPIGMVLIGYTLLHITQDEYMIRVFWITSSMLTILFVFLLFRRLANSFVALCITTVMLFSPVFLQQAPQFLNDIPSAGLLFGVLWLVHRNIHSLGKSKSVYLVSILVASAFYIRYGTVIHLFVIVVVTSYILHIKMHDDNADFFDGNQIRLTSIILLLLLIPHIVHSYVSYGSGLGILQHGGSVAGRSYIGEGLVEYVRLLPSDLNGTIVGLFSIVGFFITLVFSLSKKLRTKYLYIVWIGLIGLLTFVATGLLVHAEARYVFFPLVLLAGVGILGTYTVINEYSKVLSNSLLIMFFILSICYGYVYFGNTNAFFVGRESNRARNSYVEAAAIIKEDSGTGDCIVWAQAFRPELSWYTECNTLAIKDSINYKKNYLANFKKPHYSVVFTGLESTQISKATSGEFDVSLTELYKSKSLSPALGELIVYKVTDKGIRNSSDTYKELKHPYDELYHEHK